MDYKKLQQEYSLIKQKSLHGRYVTLEMIEPLLLKRNVYSQQSEVLGHSIMGKPIYGLKMGNGKLRILAWSQMHGNESTTTKAVMDLINFFDTHKGHKLLDEVILYLVPMLNPDGAERYTRVNANAVDLNRDAQQLTQPESLLLHDLYKDFKPDYCLNLHGQRTIFGVGKIPQSAILSFLSPAQEKTRTVTLSRKRGMSIINSINAMLQEFIPGSVGRYDDSFNINCVGDTLQAMDIPTILFEAGHIDGDYGREQVRSLVYLALIRTIEAIAGQGTVKLPSSHYFKIPENRKCFFDHIVRKVHMGKRGVTDVAVHYKEVLRDGEVHFVPLVEKIGGLKDFVGHKEWNCHGENINFPDLTNWSIGSEIKDMQLSSGRTITFSLKLPLSL